MTDTSLTVDEMAEQLAAAQGQAVRAFRNAIDQALEWNYRPLRHLGVVVVDELVLRTAVEMGLIESVYDALPPEMRATVVLRIIADHVAKFTGGT